MRFFSLFLTHQINELELQSVLVLFFLRKCLAFGLMGLNNSLTHSFINPVKMGLRRGLSESDCGKSQ